MAKRGPKIKYSPETLEKAIDRYFLECEERGVCPDYAGMRVALNVSKNTLERYCSDEAFPAEAAEYRDVLTRARDRRESWYVRHMSSEPRTASGCLAALKQADNGGWVDRAEVAASVQVTFTNYDPRKAGK